MLSGCDCLLDICTTNSIKILVPRFEFVPHSREFNIKRIRRFFLVLFQLSNMSSKKFKSSSFSKSFYCSLIHHLPSSLNPTLLETKALKPLWRIYGGDWGVTISLQQNGKLILENVVSRVMTLLVQKTEQTSNSHQRNITQWHMFTVAVLNLALAKSCTIYQSSKKLYWYYK